jgi:hypothetical protein
MYQDIEGVRACDYELKQMNKQCVGNIFDLISFE